MTLSGSRMDSSVSIRAVSPGSRISSPLTGGSGACAVNSPR
ncbi:hypothetical protein R2D22_35710 [Streptomyces sp. HUAS YS2]|uniref:Uncharacterized protein n=1 Tax=Streptomyces solicathayae TaxID=3081768 RepID=A0ABZ0M3T2_9ACTN|nr:hypothetical protein [Streptomyces sp. HUAS YS2]WOX26438.1 hypothetical protein R2D22_35710 [Streptomyces sp. HUAS YS2]